MKSKADYVRDWIRRAGSDWKIARDEMATSEPAADENADVIIDAHVVKTGSRAGVQFGQINLHFAQCLSFSIRVFAMLN